MIVQNDTGNQYGGTVIVPTINTGRPGKDHLPTHIYLEAEVELTAPSIILVDQIRTISKDRLMEYIETLSAAHMREVNSALLVSVGVRDCSERPITIPICKVCIK